ncbi:hypothetical protein P255_02963 [Acinetobacter brisouii CIP 110357]|uniref:Uncharacterized protein n=1 Tax=Acinetobacter brisouii CIP 110357 TaxID=1341683 RepID=V2UG42_9GAMM|nr:hypothetical protein F954_02839 [Acinetobacter brisouii ANC 4119]ESK47481.1 hypothetical protein P255_02963 [Acinetobacter brisouii CIP 110357]
MLNFWLVIMCCFLTGGFIGAAVGYKLTVNIIKKDIQFNKNLILGKHLYRVLYVQDLSKNLETPLAILEAERKC